ncbi:MAG: DNA-processing protein DprA [Clostridia bacterium]|nr:DNA-processing protein DprA [Clostridia bacterium]
MTEALAMAVLAGALPAYGRRNRALLAAGGSAERLCRDPGAFGELLGPEAVAAVRKGWLEAERLAGTLERERITLLLRDDAGYPSLLREIHNPPHVLFVAGEPELSDPVCIAAVGTREPSEYGLRHARRIASELAEAGCCVVSGLALGIDAACHRGALDARGRTVAVLGGALDEFYPKENRPLMERILSEGGSVVSEYPPGTKPSRYSFLHRNRIIAGMALGVFVAEGRQRSGALRTAGCALEEGRDVFALPGNIDEATSSLPNQLISEGAKPVTCASDILCELRLTESAPAIKRRSGAPAQTSTKRPAKPHPAAQQPEAQQAVLSVPEGIGEREESVCRALLSGTQDFDELTAATGLADDELGALLIEMELDGLIEALPGNRFSPGERFSPHRA